MKNSIFTPPGKEEPSTPGPWLACSEGVYSSIIKEIECPSCHKETTENILSASEGLEVKPADLRLIAAAPELLESLEEIFALIDSNTLVRNIDDNANPGFAGRAIRLVQSLGKAQQAIAKARNVNPN